MSLINDALKRAKESNSTSPTPRPTGPRMMPVEAKTASLWPLLLIPIVLVTLFGVAVILLLKGMQSSSHQNNPPPSPLIPAVAAREANLPLQPSSEPISVSATIANPTTPPKAESIEAASPTTIPAPIDSPALDQASSFPSLKLQAIFYRESNPSVMINSETLFLGDIIEKARITKITRTGVTLEWQKEIRNLSLR